MSHVLLSVFSRRRADGHRLHDGNAAAFNPATGLVATLPEDRLTGDRHGEGFAGAARECLSQVGYARGDRIALAFSSALDEPWQPEAARSDVHGLLPDLAIDDVTVFDHHACHAAVALLGVPVSEAYVLVVDAMGNWVDGRWQTETLYRAHKSSSGAISLGDPIRTWHEDGRGWGQIWRAVTKRVGFPSYHDASKTMALAGIAMGRGLEPAWPSEDRTVLDAIAARLDVLAPAASLDHALARMGILVGARWPAADWYSSHSWQCHGTSTLTSGQLRLALAAQQGLQAWLEDVADSLDPALPLCLSGGVAMNCVAAGRLARSRSVHVAAAPGDDGQALGALALLTAERGIDLPALDVAFLGGSYDGSLSFLEDMGWVGSSPDPDRVAELLCRGSVIALYRGRSEFGPRALGHRSLVTAPFATEDQKLTLRHMKHREDYQPFGVSISADAVLTAHAAASPYMSLADAGAVPSELGEGARFLVHDDGTVRYQTVTDKSDAWYHALLQEMFMRTGVPAVVNTSLNARSQPVVESHEQLMGFLSSAMGVDALVTEQVLYLSRTSSAFR